MIERSFDHHKCTVYFERISSKFIKTGHLHPKARSSTKTVSIKINTTLSYKSACQLQDQILTISGKIVELVHFCGHL